MPREPKMKILDVWPLGKSFGFRFKDRGSSYKWIDYTLLNIRKK